MGVSNLAYALTRARFLRSVEASRSTLGKPLMKLLDLIDELDLLTHHLLCDGVVVDLMAFAHEGFTAEIIATATAVAALRDIRFVRPELLLVTHLLRPGPRGAIAAIELMLARREAGDFDEACARRWAAELGKTAARERAFTRADEMRLG